MLDNPKQFLKSLPNKPGVYQMYDAKHQILYIGKAKSLKLRLFSYFRLLSDSKTKVFMELVKSIEIIVTPSENDALLLESNLIKAKKPRYNILFKDDKSFPYIFLSQHDFPRLSIYRGAIDKADGKYFGPFPNVAAVNFVLDLLQKIFQLRVCKDSVIRNRSRPCMLYQIKRCSAPCVGHVDKETYAMQVKLVEEFLHNKSDYMVQKLTKLDYEQAANYRDQIANIRKVQVEQAITKAYGNIDVIALVANEQNICINVLFVRNGLVIGNKTYFPQDGDFVTPKEEILAAFIMHYYLPTETSGIVPDKILLNMKLANSLQVSQIFQEKFGHKIKITDLVKGEQKRLVTMAEANGNNALQARQISNVNYTKCLLDFKNTMHLSSMPGRLECFDVSHTRGEAEVASCVVFNEIGPSKSDYRRFNIKTTDSGDDYGALREVLSRHLSETKDIPNVIIIDGGAGTT